MKTFTYTIEGDEVTFDNDEERHLLKNLKSFVIFNSGGMFFSSAGILLFFFSLILFMRDVTVGTISLIISFMLFWLYAKFNKEHLGLHFHDKNSRFNSDTFFTIFISSSIDEVHKEVEKLDKIIASKGLPKVNIVTMKGDDITDIGDIENYQ